MARSNSRWNIRRAAILATALTSGVLGDDLLVTSGFTNCEDGSAITVQKADISYNNADKTVVFDVAGTSNKQQNVTATLSVTAYGQDVYTNSFNPCESGTYVEQLCPVPVGTFGAKGSQAIPSQYANSIPAIAFQIPDIAAEATLQLKSLDNGKDVGCIQSQVTNGKTATVAAVSFVAAGVAGAALLVGSAGALSAALSGSGSAASGAGAATASPSFGEIFGVFQGFAMNGMMSAKLPQVYRSFSANFAFSTGLIPWEQMQVSIDNFRQMTGGNLTNDGVDFLRKATLVYPDGSSASSNSSSIVGRALANAYLAARDIETSVNGTNDGNSTSGPDATLRTIVNGIQAYAERLSVPQANTFMTVLLIVAIVIGVIVVGILLVKVILETWALFGNFPESLTGFRKHYWGSIARAITSLILLLYSIWVLYCVFQFTHGDSWAAQTLAGVTLAIFTSILIFFSWKIWSMAHKLKNAEGDASALYEDKKIWVKYSLFYESYKKDYWWIFVPVILYMFAKGCVLAATNGHGLSQAVSLLVVEGLMLSVLIWSRPFERKSGNVVNIAIQVVRVLSVVCILIFVEEFGIAETTQTVAGVVLIAIQSALAGILAILIAYNAIIACFKQNPHRKRRKEMEKMQRDMDTLTPLDARNSLLLERVKTGETKITISYNNAPSDYKLPVKRDSSDQYMSISVEPTNAYSPLNAPYNRPLTPSAPMGGANPSRDNLVHSAAPITQQPTIPNVGGGYPAYNQGQQNGYAGYRQPGY
ncbi:TRP-domain-containing protein [Annulohypoxylon maeteangense]|uniref:TRP-domain-containing protein n=1 Tax=Annulohypoxylon maeteangense TaxID=1927788 RepID=UPI002007B0D1|nr:TRP-domain-containing protein [Annulohypoxylon maeteangense]KAI0889140.1 TRP-domain-containing protein [Annulohypoxylon maeteangense]